MKEKKEKEVWTTCSKMLMIALNGTKMQNERLSVGFKVASAVFIIMFCIVWYANTRFYDLYDQKET